MKDEVRSRKRRKGWKKRKKCTKERLTRKVT